MTKPRTLGAGLSWQLEVHLREVHDDSVGIGECKGREVDFPIEVDHKSGLFIVPTDAQVCGEDLLLHCGRKRVLCHSTLGRQAGRVAEQRTSKSAGDGNRAGCHESEPFITRFFNPLGGVSVNGT